VSLSQSAVFLSCECPGCLPGLLPHLSAVVTEDVRGGGGLLSLRVRAAAPGAACPRCGTASEAVHSGYLRRLRDLPAGGAAVVIWLAVRRFFCVSPGCAAVTFAEQPAGLASRYARRTPPLAAALCAVAAAAGGRPGARLGAALGMPASRDSMIRLVMAVPLEDAAACPQVLGIDDFALRKGRSYGTVLIDVGTGQVIELLADREAATVQAWLQAHPGASVICRDRAGAYAEAAREGAPGAVQAADRWHLLHNLGEHVRDAAARCKGRLGEPRQDPPADPEAVIRERHAAVRALRAAGKDPAAAAAALGIGIQAAGRLWRAPSAAALLAPARPAPGLGPWKPWLDAQLAQGSTNIGKLHAEITARGYAGSYSTTHGYASLSRLAAPPRPPAPPAPRRVAAWIMTRPGRLDPASAAALAGILGRCPELAALAGHAREFAEITAGRLGETRLDDWLAAAGTEPGQPELASFANGIRRDYHAVRNGLTLPWSSGKVEGTVNKIKTIKRQMYGRASLAHLRKRVLLANQAK
jgi:transposase